MRVDNRVEDVGSGKCGLFLNEHAFQSFTDDAFQIRATVTVSLVGKLVQVNSGKVSRTAESQSYSLWQQ